MGKSERESVTCGPNQGQLIRSKLTGGLPKAYVNTGRLRQHGAIREHLGMSHYAWRLCPSRFERVNSGCLRLRPGRGGERARDRHDIVWQRTGRHANERVSAFGREER